MEPPEIFLSHFGILGMKWGVRRERGPTQKLNVRTSGITINSDGSMLIEKGAKLQRLVRKDGSSMPLKDITYASLTEYDNAKYIKYIGGKGFFGGGRDTVLQLTAKTRIKAPSEKEATKIVSDMFIKDKNFRNIFTTVVGSKISQKELNDIIKEPTGKTAKAWYTLVNTSLTFSKDFDSSAPYVQKAFREAFSKKGFNAIRDENDFQAGVSKSPIIIFSPEKSLKVTKVSDITDDLRIASKETLKAYKDLGKDWVEKQLYTK